MTGDTLNLMTIAACIAAECGYAAYEVAAENHEPPDSKPPRYEAKNTEMSRILGCLKDTKDVPPMSQALLGTRAYERLPS